MNNRNLLLLLLIACLAGLVLIESVYAVPEHALQSKRTISDPLYGVTVDSLDDVDGIVDALKHLPVVPAARIVFDERAEANEYRESLERIHKYSYVMGELLDSCPFSKYSTQHYLKRIEEYVFQLGDLVDIWEIGNEVNGEWLGKIPKVKEKVIAAYEAVKKHHYPVALTLFYNVGCAATPEHEMYTWVENQLPEHIREGLDYVFVSYYPDSCDLDEPDWNLVFFRLRQLFPHAKLGFGECGTEYSDEKQKAIEQAYTSRIAVHNYVGGYFWWYFMGDMVPRSKPLWHVLANSMHQQKMNFYILGEEYYPNLANGLRVAFWSAYPISQTYPTFRLMTTHSEKDVAEVKQNQADREQCGGEETAMR